MLMALWRIVLRSLLLAVSTLLTLELGLQVWAVYATSWARDAEVAAPVRILCIGDSHTFGSGVADDESYPAQLQQRLDAVSPGRFAVINLGQPGMSAVQMRNRIASETARYAPDLVILWGGVNDDWNLRELSAGEASWVQRLDGWATRSRVYRFVRVWQHDRRLDREVATVRAGGMHQLAPRPRAEEATRVAETATPGRPKKRRDPFAHHAPVPGGEGRVFEAHEATLAQLRAAGIPVVAVRYPLEIGPFGAANRALDSLAEMYELPVVDAAEAVSRVPAGELEWTWGAHPNAPVYAELANDLVPYVLELTGDAAAVEARTTPPRAR
jgi:lysophospholipase L1-like esterase